MISTSVKTKKNLKDIGLGIIFIAPFVISIIVGYKYLLEFIVGGFAIVFGYGMSLIYYKKVLLGKKSIGQVGVSKIYALVLGVWFVIYLSHSLKTDYRKMANNCLNEPTDEKVRECLENGLYEDYIDYE